MLAAVRRGPFAQPTAFERIEYLFTRVKKGQTAMRFDRYGLEHCMSYQRRVHAIKLHFLRRQHETPLGIVTDYWERWGRNRHTVSPSRPKQSAFVVASKAQLGST